MLLTKLSTWAVGRGWFVSVRNDNSTWRLRRDNTKEVVKASYGQYPMKFMIGWFSLWAELGDRSIHSRTSGGLFLLYCSLLLRLGARRTPSFGFFAPLVCVSDKLTIVELRQLPLWNLLDFRSQTLRTLSDTFQLFSSVLHHSTYKRTMKYPPSGTSEDLFLLYLSLLL